MQAAFDGKISGQSTGSENAQEQGSYKNVSSHNNTTVLLGVAAAQPNGSIKQTSFRDDNHVAGVKGDIPRRSFSGLVGVIIEKLH